MKHYDVMIVGGGVIGLLTALALLKSTSLTILLLDEKDALTDIDLTHYSPRVSAITLQSKAFFNELGVWDEMVKRRVSDFKHMAISEANHSSILTFDAGSVGKCAMGYIIENDVMLSSLHETLSHYQSFQFISRARIESLSYEDNRIQIVTNNQPVFSAKLLIGADGKESQVRTLAAIPCESKAYDANAIVATVHTQKSHLKTAYQVFLSSGPLAFLPLQDVHHASIVWSLPLDLANDKMQLIDAEFNAQLNAAFPETLGNISLVDRRFSFPLVKQQAKSYISEKIVLLGDAAHVVHPLAGQGVNLGIQDVIIFRDEIVSTIKQKRDIASYLVLRRYERAAKTSNMLMMRGIDSIHHLFVENNARLSIIRKAGLNLLSSCPALKRHIIQLASGKY